MKIHFLFLICIALTSAFEKQFFDHLSKKEGSMIDQCEFCQKVFSVLETLDEKTLDFIIAKLFDVFCPLVETKQVCKGFKNTYIFQFLNNFIKQSTNHFIFFFRSTANPERICARLDQCNVVYHRSSLQEFIKEILADKWTDQQKQEWLEKSKISNSDYKIVQLTDLHIDLEYESGYNAFCDEPFCCRGENGLPSDPANGAQYWGTIAQCDLPLRTVENLVEYIKTHIKPDLIIWNGDNISHDIWHQNPSNQTLPTRRITEVLLREGIKLYPIYGNHENYPCDQMDFEGGKTQWLLDDVTKLWQTVLNEQSLNSLKNYGYYSQYDEDKNIKFIALNTQTCDLFNFYLFQNNTDPSNHLVWLKNQLKEAEENYQFVYIFGHIPPNGHFCSTQWTQRYNVLMERYQHVVKGQIFGHTHQDHFNLVNSEVNGEAQSITFVAPSGTTYSFQVPSFRVYEINGEDNRIENYFQYRLDLEKANKEGKSAKLDWLMAYDFKSFYELSEISVEQIDKLIQRMESDKDFQLLKSYIKNYWSGSEVLVEKEMKQYNSHMFREATRSFYLCSMKYSTFDEIFDCTSKLRLVQSQEVLLFRILEELYGKWRYKE